MIQIIKGTYGYLTKNGTVKPWTEKDGPLSLTKEQEARLVGLGVAVYVDEKPSQAEPEATTEESLAVADEEKPLEDMTAKELRELGKEYGLTFKVGLTKADMIKAIQAEWPQPTEDEEETDDEPAPTFDAAEAVE